jgi:Uma2 family endonuclease
MTAEEFCDWVHRPENDNRWFELVRGEVIELPRPNRQQGRVCVNVAYQLSNYLHQRGYGYATLNDAGVILGRDPDTVRGPDVAVYEDATSFEEMPPGRGEVPPRLAVEVLLPDEKAARVFSKIADYLSSGVDLVRVVDPEARAVVVHRGGRNPPELKGDAELTGDDVLPGFRCRVADFFFMPGETPK